MKALRNIVLFVLILIAVALAGWGGTGFFFTAGSLPQDTEGPREGVGISE